MQEITKEEVILDVIIEVPELKSIFTKMKEIANNMSIFDKDLFLQEIEDQGLIENTFFDKDYTDNTISYLKSKLHFNTVIDVDSKVKENNIKCPIEKRNCFGIFLDAELVKGKLKRAKFETFKKYENYYGIIDNG